MATVVIGGIADRNVFNPICASVICTLCLETVQNPNLVLAGLFVVLLLLSSIPYAGHSQTPIGLQAAIDTALHNNLVIKNEQLKTEYLKKNSGCCREMIPKMNVSGEFGQINSYYSDN